MKRLFRDNQYGIGVILVLISAVIYLLGINAKEDAAFGFFFFHFILNFLYWLSIIITVIFNRKTFQFYRIFPALTLSLISAYSLNRCMNIFDLSPLWFSIVLVVISIACLSLAFFQEMSRLLRFSVLTITGMGMIVFLYLSYYLIPVYPIGLIAFWVLGISLHTFVPLTFIVFISIWIYRFGKSDKKALWGLAVGAGFTILVVVVFTLRWSYTVNLINDTYRETFVEDDTTLPAWIRVAQRIPQNDITNKALKVDISYIIPDFDYDGFRNFDFPSRFNEPKIHDPLIVIAGRISGVPCLSNNEKIKILESIYDCRNQATERLWSDDGIETSYVNSSILVWPQYRMAYTEQIIMIRNTKESWRSAGEAVYTFHLPEGSVATSLSLWINGYEEKGILTTKQKADSAYRTIVGVEARDPSLVHWQEGSTLSIRVFPVTTDEERVFKIGITSPLQKKDERLVYEPIYFEGTDYTKAKAVNKVTFMQTPKNLKYPSFFKQEDLELTSKNKVRYNNQWTISMDDSGLSDKSFHFNDYSYSVHELQTKEIPVDIRNVYLDINQSWSKKEFETILDAAKDKKIWVYDGRKIKAISSENKHSIFNALKEQQFSLFPIHKIKQPKQSLLISKSTSVSPNLSDLEKTPFYDDFKKTVNPNNPVYFFSLGDELSPYLKTLREYRLLNYSQGDMAELKKILSLSVFIQSSPESDDYVNVHDAGLQLRRMEADSLSKSEAPDHLMRLFAYNHIMFRYMEGMITSTTELLVAEAQQAYVVSPVSSLVVLESQVDYDRFDIADTENSLRNASKNSKGAIPEPHEWALLIIAGTIAIYMYIRRRRIVE